MTGNVRRGRYTMRIPGSVGTLAVTVRDFLPVVAEFLEGCDLTGHFAVTP